MDPLSITASIIAVIQLTGSIVSAVYSYRRGIKNAPEGAVKIIQDLTGLSQVLEELLQLIERERSNKTSRLTSLEGLVGPDGPLESCQKTLQTLNRLLQPENGWRAVKQSMVWPLKKDYITNALDEIATAKVTIGLALTVDQTSLALETKDGVDALRSSFNSFRIEKQLDSALSDLSATDPTFNHSEARRKHQTGTGVWLTSSEQYLKWVSTADSFLWINGIRVYCPIAFAPVYICHS